MSDDLFTTIGRGIGVLIAVGITAALIANWRDVLSFTLFMSGVIGLLWLIGWLATWMWENCLRRWVDRWLGDE